MLEYVTPDTLPEKTVTWLDAISPFNTHEWLPDPASSALLVIDCQNYFVSLPEPDGVPILPNIKALMNTFRDVGRPVIFTRHMHKSDKSDFGMIGEWWPENIIEDTWESELHPSLDVAPSDIVIRKNRYSAFHETDLENILKNAGVRDVIITGVMTNLCCETTARDAYSRDYRVFLVADATGSVSEEMHFATLLNASFGFAVVLDTKQIQDVFSRTE